MTWILRGCPHCGGDTFLSKDIDNSCFETCLQCGYDAPRKAIDDRSPVVVPANKKRIRQLVRSN